MLSSGLGIVGFSWASSPVCTELETIIMNWIGKMSGLPETLLPFKQKEKIKQDQPINNNLRQNMASGLSLSFEDINNNNLNDIINEHENAINDVENNNICELSRSSGGVLLVNAIFFFIIE